MNLTINRSTFILLFICLTLFAVSCNSGVISEPSPIPPPPNLDEITPLAPNPEGNEGVLDDENVTSDPNEEESGESEATPLADEEPTDTPEPTPTLAATAVPVSEPPIQNVSSTGLPPTARDFLFLGDGALKLWTHQNRQIIDLLSGGDPPEGEQRLNSFTSFVGDVTHFDVSADGNRVVAARLTRAEMISGSIDDGESVITQRYSEHEILFIDVVSKEIWTLAENVTDLQTVKISPNQQTVAFIASGLVANPEPEVTTNLPALNVYTVLTPDKGNLKAVASCADFCSTLVWHSNSELFFYSDADAMWLYNLTASSPEALINNIATGSPAERKVYSPISLASNGRYLLLWQGGWEGGSRVVYDIPTQQLIPVPDSFVYADPFPTEVSWMPDTRLLVTRNSIDGTTWTPTLEIYRISLDEGRLNLEESTSPEHGVGAVGTKHLENGRFAYVLVNQDDTTLSGAYIQTSFTEPPVKQGGVLPSFAAPVASWSPVGDGVVFTHNSVTYFSGNGGPINMTAEFGQFASDFTWLPQTAVNR